MVVFVELFFRWVGGLLVVSSSSGFGCVIVLLSCRCCGCLPRFCDLLLLSLAEIVVLVSALHIEKFKLDGIEEIQDQIV